jgi:hypothetical protein
VTLSGISPQVCLSPKTISVYRAPAGKLNLNNSELTRRHQKPPRD